MPAASVPAAVFTRFAGTHGREAEVRRGNLGRDGRLVVGDLVRIDFTVMIEIEHREEALGVLLHLVNA